MNQEEKARTIQRYNERLAAYGPTEKALGWGDKGRSRVRFEVLLSRWSLDNSRILDFGCGFGDLYGYMCTKGIRGFSYLGVDINPSLIAIARDRYPRAEFLVADCTSDIPGAPFHYILSSGVFNFKLEDNRAFIAEMFSRFNALAQRGYAANFLSNRVQYKLEHTYHADPAEILNMAYQASNNVVLRNDYMPYEFTVFVTKDAAIDPRLTVYEDFTRFES